MEELSGKNIVVFDLEIKNEIGKNGVTWQSFEKMGISVGVAFDYRAMDYLIFMDDNIQELRRRLATSDLVVGFNITGFDLPLLAASTEKVEKNQNLEIYDILYWSRISVGWNDPDAPQDPILGHRTSRFPSGLKLDDHLEGTFGKEHMKTANGAEAPLMWQRKELGRLTSYCLADVKRERQLFEHVVKGLPVKTATHGVRILELPKYLKG